MTNQPKKRGGRREPPGGRPRKDNVRLVCYVAPHTYEEIEKSRGALTRGEFIDLLVMSCVIKRSNEN